MRPDYDSKALPNLLPPNRGIVGLGTNHVVTIYHGFTPCPRYLAIEHHHVYRIWSQEVILLVPTIELTS